MSTLSSVNVSSTGSQSRAYATARARGSLLARLTGWCVAASVIGGSILGLLLAASSALGFHSLLGVREWCDVLSYSVVAHASLWFVYGLIVSAMFGFGLLLSSRLRRAVRPSTFAISALVAGAAVLLVWTSALEMGLGLAVGLQRTWLALMAAAWCLVFTSAWRVVAWVADTRFATLSARVSRPAFVVCLTLIAGSGAAQWYEWPRLIGDDLDVSALAAPAVATAHTKPNVVLIVMDTQRADRLGCYGYTQPTTPKIDAFAKDAHVFENATSAAVWTLPSHASIFTGLFPSEHGTGRNHRWLDDDFVTMAELLKRADYQTVAFSNNLYISETCNMTQGFDDVFWPIELHIPRGNRAAKLVRGVLKPAGFVGKALGAATNQDAGGKFTTQVVARWLERRDRQRPFFLFVNLMEAHAPYEPHLPHRRVFMDQEEVDASYQRGWGQAIAFSLLQRDCYSNDDLALLNKTYDAETRMLDDYVSLILESIARQAGLDNTLIILTADHGENLGDHHLIDHQWCVYDTLSHVPLIVRYPSRIPPGRSKQLVQSVDLLPTVIDAVCGTSTATASTFGRSLFSLAKQSGQERQDSAAVSHTSADAMGASSPPDSAASQPAFQGRAVVTERISPADPPLATAQRIDCRFDRSPHLGVLRSIRQDDWKLIVHADGRQELYNIAADPGEIDNQLATHRPIAELLADRLDDWLAVSRPYGGDDAEATGPSLDKRVRQRLKSLGYIQ